MSHQGGEHSGGGIPEVQRPGGLTELSCLTNSQEAGGGGAGWGRGSGVDRQGQVAAGPCRPV